MTYYPIPLPIAPSGYLGDTSQYVTFSGSYVFNVYSGLPVVMNIYSGGFINIFEGSNGTYLLNTPSGLHFTADGDTYTTVRYGSVLSVTQIESAFPITLIFKTESTRVAGVYAQTSPETTGGWIKQTTISGITVTDSASDPDGIISTQLPIIVGNGHASLFPRIFRNDNRQQPFGVFTDSDTGIPQVSPTIAQITDLEAV